MQSLSSFQWDWVFYWKTLSVYQRVFRAFYLSWRDFVMVVSQLSQMNFKCETIPTTISSVIILQQSSALLLTAFSTLNLITASTSGTILSIVPFNCLLIPLQFLKLLTCFSSILRLSLYSSCSSTPLLSSCWPVTSTNLFIFFHYCVYYPSYHIYTGLARMNATNNVSRRPTLTECDNLAKRCEYLNEKVKELRAQVGQFQSEITGLKEENAMLERVNKELVGRLGRYEEQGVKEEPAKQASKLEMESTRICRLPDYQLRQQLSHITTNFLSFANSTHLLLDPLQSPKFTSNLSILDKKFQTFKSVLKTLNLSLQKTITTGRNYFGSLAELRNQLQYAAANLHDSIEVSLLLKYVAELVKEGMVIGGKLVRTLEETVLNPLVGLQKGELEGHKDAKKKYQKQFEQYTQILNKIPTLTKCTPLIEYSQYLKSYFQSTQSMQSSRLTLLQSYNKSSLLLNDQLTTCLLCLLVAFKNQFNQYKQFIYELEDLTLFLANCRGRKQEMRKVMLGKLREEREERKSGELTMEGYLFMRTTQRGEFVRRYYVIENGRLYSLENQKMQLVKKDVLPLELTNLKIPQQVPYVNCFELSSPSIKSPLLFIAQTQYHLKQWLVAIANNIQLKISHPTTKPTLNQPSSTNKKTIQKLISQSLCADCSRPNPSWISSNFLVLICHECSGFHRKFVTISRIRSLKLDVNDNQKLSVFLNYGNNFINGILEGNITIQLINIAFTIRLNSSKSISLASNLRSIGRFYFNGLRKPKENSDAKEKEQWVRWKYLERRFVDWNKLRECPELQQEIEKLGRQG